MLLSFSAPPAVIAAAGACADPAITAAVALRAADDGSLSTYEVTITVRNLGTQNERSSLLQSVEIFQDTDKTGQIGTPPLRAGASAKVKYRFQRSSEASPGTTHLRMHLVMRDPHGLPVTNCSTNNDTFRINV